MVFLYVVLMWEGMAGPSRIYIKLGVFLEVVFILGMAHRTHRVTRSQSSDGDFVYRGQFNDGNTPRRVVPEGGRYPIRVVRSARRSPCRFPTPEGVGNQGTVDDVIQFYQDDKSARFFMESKWCYESFVKLAAARLTLGEEAKRAFLYHPDHTVVKAVINELISHGWTGDGAAPLL